MRWAADGIISTAIDVGPQEGRIRLSRVVGAFQRQLLIPHMIRHKSGRVHFQFLAQVNRSFLRKKRIMGAMIRIHAPRQVRFSQVFPGREKVCKFAVLPTTRLLARSPPIPQFLGRNGRFTCASGSPCPFGSSRARSKGKSKGKSKGTFPLVCEQGRETPPCTFARVPLSYALRILRSYTCLTRSLLSLSPAPCTLRPELLRLCGLHAEAGEEAPLC